MLDYRELLKRYIAKVRDSESVDYIDHPSSYHDPLSREDKAELRALEIESARDYPETA